MDRKLNGLSREFIILALHFYPDFAERTYEEEHMRKEEPTGICNIVY